MQGAKERGGRSIESYAAPTSNEGNAADDALMVDQGHYGGVDEDGGCDFSVSSSLFTGFTMAASSAGLSFAANVIGREVRIHRIATAQAQEISRRIRAFYGLPGVEISGTTPEDFISAVTGALE